MQIKFSNIDEKGLRASSVIFKASVYAKACFENNNGKLQYYLEEF